MGSIIYTSPSGGGGPKGRRGCFCSIHPGGRFLGPFGTSAAFQNLPLWGRCPGGAERAGSVWRSVPDSTIRPLRRCAPAPPAGELNRQEVRMPKYLPYRKESSKECRSIFPPPLAEAGKQKNSGAFCTAVSVRPAGRFHLFTRTSFRRRPDPRRPLPQALLPFPRQSRLPGWPGSRSRTR